MILTFGVRLIRSKARLVETDVAKSIHNKCNYGSHNFKHRSSADIIISIFQFQQDSERITFDLLEPK